MKRRKFIKDTACAGCLGLFGGCLSFGDGLYYRFGGEVHRDFHASGGAVFEVKACPARAHLVKRGIAGGEGLCELTRVFNEELVKGTPFEIETSITSDGSCRQTLRRRNGGAA